MRLGIEPRLLIHSRSLYLQANHYVEPLWCVLGFHILFILTLNYNFSIYHITSLLPLLIYYFLIILLLVQELCFLYMNIQFIHLC